MPIRMEDDPRKPQRENQNNQDNKRGGSGIGKFLPFIFMFLFKKPKLLIPVIVIGALLYFFGFFDSFLGGGDSAQPEVSQFTFGAEFNQVEFDKTEVFEALSSGYGAPSLPRRVSLAQYAPSRGHQGRQGSCVGWASSYAARTILHSRATGAAPDQVAFSPSFLYNQIALTNCQGAYMKNAMRSLHEVGDLPFRQFGYDERSCNQTPNRNELAEASKYRIKGYNRLTIGGGNYGPDIQAIKQNLAQGAPAVIGMMVGGTFMQGMIGKEVWYPTQRDYQQYGFSGHAMCVIGYDDNKEGGAFEIMNSWGPEWGRNGIGWVRYNDFERFTKEVYGMYPMGSASNMDPNKLGVKVGLVDNATQTLIPLRNRGNGLFETRRNLTAQDRFKVAVTNSVESYIYVFGEETDGSSYVLFPYSEKHSPYCGIVGTRVFPKDQSMSPDQIGNRDRIAVIVSKQELNFNNLNQIINRSRQRTYLDKVMESIRSEQVQNVRFTDEDGAIGFEAQLNGKNIVGVVIEVTKG